MSEQFLISKDKVHFVLSALSGLLTYNTTTSEYAKGREAITALRTAIEQAKRQQALDKMAENERELGIQMQPEQDRYQWLVDNAASWSWNPARYNAEKISGFARKGTGYLGYSFDEAVNLAMEESIKPTADHIPDAGKMVGPCKYPKCPYPCPDLPDCKDAEKQQAPAAVVNQQLTTEAAAPVQDSNHEFQNFHRLLCERFGYTHDEVDWKRDQISLIEWIAKQVKPTPVQEPCAECFGQGIQGEDGDGIVSGVTWKCDACNGSGKEHPAPAAPVQEPVIQRVMARLADLLDEDQFKEIEGMVVGAGYTPPAAQRQWVGLTIHEMDDAFDASMKARPKDASNAETRRLFVQAIEAKLREKNGG